MILNNDFLNKNQTASIFLVTDENLKKNQIFYLLNLEKLKIIIDFIILNNYYYF